MIHAPHVSSSVPAPFGSGEPRLGEPLDELDWVAGSPLTWWHPLPWSLERKGTTWVLRLEHAREEMAADRANRELLLACGAVVENLRIALRQAGSDALVTEWPEGLDSSVVARVVAGDAITPRLEDLALFHFLHPPMSAEADAAAHSAGSAASAGSGGVTPAAVAVLRHAARVDGCWLDVIADDARLEMVGDLEAEALRILDAERGARRLLAARNGSPRAAPVVEFVPGGEPGLDELLACLGAPVRPVPRWSGAGSLTGRDRALEAPLLAVLGAPGDLPADWLHGGAALQRVLLHAGLQGLSACFLNEPLQHPLLRDALGALLFGNGVPQVLIRFDVAVDPDAPRLRAMPPMRPAAPRRPRAR